MRAGRGAAPAPARRPRGKAGAEPAERPRLGPQLRAAREARGLSLADLAAQLRVRPELLAALESDDPAVLAEPVYARARLREYARAVGLEPEAVLSAYGRAATPPPPPRRRVPLWPLAGGLLALGLAAAGVTYLVRSGLQARVPARAAPAVEAPPGTARTVGLSVTSEPPGATVLVDRFRVGVTPLRDFPVSAGPDRELRVELDGYLPERRTLDLRTPQALSLRLRPRTGAATGVATSRPAVSAPAPAPARAAAPRAAAAVSPAPARAADPAPAVPRPQPQAATPSPPARGAGPVTLTFRGRSWVRVTDASGRALFEGIPRVGASLRYREPVIVRVGNPAAVSASGEGWARSSLGGVRRVTTVRLP